MSEPHEQHAHEAGAAVPSHGVGQGLLVKRRRFLWFSLAALMLAIVLAMTASFRLTGFVLAGLLLVLAGLRGFGREEGLLFAARGRTFDAIVLSGCASGLVLFSIIAPA